MPQAAKSRVRVRKAPARPRAARARVARAPAERPMVRSAPAKAEYSFSNLGPIGKGGRLAGAALGGYLGGPAGSALGSVLGGAGGHLLGRIFGSGDYVTSGDQVKYNVLANSAQVPQFGHGKNVVNIRHREYLGDVITSSTIGAFQLTDYPIQPGLVGSFPWLAQVCGSTFQQYRINGMVFEFRSMSADALNSTNTALGSVVMATDYDSKDATFTSKQEMENTEFGVSCKPSSCMMHAIECARNQTAVSELYIRAGSVPSGADIRLYDMGRFSIATSGFQAASVNVGELWVSYDITLLKAIQQPPGFLIPSAHYQLNPANLATAVLSVLSTNAGIDTIGLSIDSTGLILRWPVSIPVNSQWMVVLHHQTNAGGAANATVINTALSNGMVGLDIQGTPSSPGHGWASPNPSPGTAVRELTSVTFLKYSGGATPAALPTLTFTAPTVPLASYLNGDLYVTMINGGIAF